MRTALSRPGPQVAGRGEPCPLKAWAPLQAPQARRRGYSGANRSGAMTEDIAQPLQTSSSSMRAGLPAALQPGNAIATSAEAAAFKLASVAAKQRLVVGHLEPLQSSRNGKDLSRRHKGSCHLEPVGGAPSQRHRQKVSLHVLPLQSSFLIFVGPICQP